MAVCWTRKSEIENLAALLDGVPACQHADGRQQTDKHHQPQAQPVDADVVVNRRVLDPGLVDLKLEAALTLNEVRRQMQREAEGDQRREQGDPVR